MKNSPRFDKRPRTRLFEIRSMWLLLIVPNAPVAASVFPPTSHACIAVVTGPPEPAVPFTVNVPFALNVGVVNVHVGPVGPVAPAAPAAPAAPVGPAAPAAPVGP